MIGRRTIAWLAVAVVCAALGFAIAVVRTTSKRDSPRVGPVPTAPSVLALGSLAPAEENATQQTRDSGRDECADVRRVGPW